MTSHTSSKIGPPVPFVNQLLTSSVDYPFNYLHIEMVKHFRDRDKAIAVKKEEWVNKCRESDFAGVLNNNNSLVNNQIFLQV